ncbi:hypothetical protein VKT23_006448 [Stygiomarasmius scandens]|uniref:Uncharacterized protein n=1 Tax=Marasmiellus scandens TaxID=2682957 RepID=A0ABR1JQC3_9AGAR
MSNSNSNQKIFDIPTASAPSKRQPPTKQAEAQRKYRKRLALKKPPKPSNPILHPLSKEALTTEVPIPSKLRWIEHPDKQEKRADPPSQIEFVMETSQTRDA